MQPPPKLTFLGHSTVLIEVGGIRLLTDPVLFDRVSILRRVPTPIDPALFAEIDVAIVSHLHLDHFDLPSLQRIGREVRLVVPQGAADLARPSGFRHVDEVAPDDLVRVDGVAITATRAVHGGFRPPLGPRGLAVGYLIETPETRIYFAGDTDVFPEMAELAPDLDVALLPVWGWGPSLGPGHLDPKRAVAALQLLQPRFAVPIHWGTLWPLGLGRVRPGRLTEPPIEFAARAAEAYKGGSVLLATPGETVSLPRSEGPSPEPAHTPRDLSRPADANTGHGTR